MAEILNKEMIDFSKAKVGNEVRSLLNGWGVKVEDRNNINYPLQIKYPHKTETYTIEGKLYRDDLYPDLVEWKPQIRKVKKELIVYINLYPDGRKSMWSSKENAKQFVNSDAIGIAIPCVGYYEVEE